MISSRAAQEVTSKWGLFGPRRLASRLSASVPCGPDLQAGRSPLFMFWTELGLPLGTFPQCLALPRIVVFFSGGEVTSIRLSSQQTNSMHTAHVSHWAPGESPPVWLPLGVNVHTQRRWPFPSEPSFLPPQFPSRSQLRPAGLPGAAVRTRSTLCGG